MLFPIEMSWAVVVPDVFINHAIDDVFRLFTASEPEDKMPLNAKHEEDIARISLLLRIESVNRDIVGWFKDCVSDSGIIDWSKQPLYLPAWGDHNMLSTARNHHMKCFLQAHLIIKAAK